MRKSKKTVDFKKVIFLLIAICGIITIVKVMAKSNEKEEIVAYKPAESNITDVSANVLNTEQNLDAVQASANNSRQVYSWEIKLVNKDNKLPNDYYIPLSTIAGDLQFDSRAIEYLNDLRNAVINAGYNNLWVQSSYRSIELQTELFNDKVESYMENGYSKEESENLTMKSINRPGTSEHNLGLAVDFNYVSREFEDLPVFNWLCENAEDYGFILRYPEEKIEITGVNYEPWHWRYVGKEHAKEINRLGYCLEEYIDYLNK